MIRYANPLYHARKICEDWNAACHAVRCRCLTGLSEEDAAKAFRGRLFAAFFIAGGCSFTGPLTSAALQFITRNYWVGLISTLIVTNTVATAAFQCAWWFSSKSLYADLHPAKARFLAMERDILPIQLRGLRWMLTISIVGLPVKSLIVLGFSTYWPQAVTFLPISVVVAGFDIVFVDSTFVRVMGDIFEQHSKVLVARHRSAINLRKEPEESLEMHSAERVPTPELASLPVR